jgi:Zn-dependent protease
MNTGGSIQLVRIFGIRIGVSVSWFVVLFVFIFTLSDTFRDQLGGSQTQGYVVAVIAALLFFGSLILHELGHALTAQRSGIEITGIDLWFFGGMAKMSRDTNSPGEEFRVSAAGPAVTLAIVALCTAIGVVVDGDTFFDLTVFDTSRGTDSAPLVLLAWLATINAFLFVFNLIPGFPLDGGRIFRSILWKITGQKAKATRWAGRTGQVIAYAMGGFGLYLIFRGNAFNGLWLAVLAVFLGQAARGAVVQSDIDERLEGVTVGDVMDPHPFTIAADMTVIDASENVFGPHGWPWVPVVERDGRFAGVLHSEAVDHALASGQPALTARDLAREDGWRWRIDMDEPLEALIGTEGMRHLGAVFAVDGQGVLRGVVTIDQVRRALTPAR